MYTVQLVYWGINSSEGIVAVKTPTVEVPTSNGTEETKEAPDVLATTPAAIEVPEGFVLLSAARKRSAPTYGALVGFVGKRIQLDEIKISDDRKSGTMTFSEFGADDSAPEYQSAIPKGALRAIIEAGQKHPDETIVAEVVQTKRGLALR